VKIKFISKKMPNRNSKNHHFFKQLKYQSTSHKLKTNNKFKNQMIHKNQILLTNKELTYTDSRGVKSL